MDNDNTLNKLIKHNLNIIKSIIKIYHNFLPSLEILLVNDNVLYSNIFDLIKNKNVELLLEKINEISVDINNINTISSDVDNYILFTFNIYKHFNTLNIILELYIYYIDFDIFTDIKVDISNTQKNNINTNKNQILKEYNVYKNIYNKNNILINTHIHDILLNNYISVDVENVLKLYKEINNIYNNSFIYINLNKDVIYTKNDNYYLIFDILNNTINSSDNKNYKINNLVIDLYIICIQFIYNSINNEDIILYINDITENDKNNILLFNNKISKSKIISNKNYNIVKYENLQTYNLKPISLYKNNLELFNIYDIIYKLLDIKLSKLLNLIKGKTNIDNICKELYNICKIYTNKININFSIIIMYKNGNLINYDLNNLINKELDINTENGINSKFIKKNNMIHNLNKNTNTKNNNMYLINYNEDNDNNILVLDTIDFINYRILTNKNIIKNIHTNLENDINIKNIVLNNIDVYNLINYTKSNRIEYYNKIIENKILKKVNPSPIGDFYNSINSNFDIFDDETIYNKLTNKILANLMNHVNKHIKKHPYKDSVEKDIYISNILFNNNDISNVFISSLYEFYFSLSTKIDESYLTYVSILDYIINKFKKDIFDNFNGNVYRLIEENLSVNDIIRDIIELSINNIINTKNHIYDMMIEKEQIILAFNKK